MTSLNVTAAFVLAAIAGWPCSIVSIVVKTGPDFHVKVEDRGKPAQDVRVKIEREGGASITAMTDRNGNADFRNVPTGSYQVTVGTDAGMADAGGIDVKPGGPKRVTLPRQWPVRSPIEVRSLRGVLHDLNYFLDLSGKTKLALDLTDARSGRRLGSVEVSEQGEFRFDGVAPGLYFMTVKRMVSMGRPHVYQTETGEIAVEVDPNSSKEDLDLDLEWNSCGMRYSDASRCGAGDLQIDRLAGQVTDSAGRALRYAQVVLFDANQKVVER